MDFMCNMVLLKSTIKGAKGMKKLLVISALMLSGLAFGGANDPKITQRNSLNNGDAVITLVRPSSDSIFYFNYANTIPRLMTLGPGFSITSDVLHYTPSSSGDWNTLTNKPGWTGVFDGSYATLTGKPTLFSGDYADLTSKPSLFSGAYADLTGKPTIPAAQVNSDWSASSGAAQILNKPSLFSGAYNDLSGKPTLFDGAYASLSGTPSTFTPSAHNQAWSTITSTPTTLAGYGIADGVSSTTLASTLSGYATTTQVNAKEPAITAGTTSQVWRGDKTWLNIATVATTGAYSDLSGKPTIPAAQVNSDWNSSSGASQILNKPALAAVATSGSYNDLTSKPTIQSIQRIRAQTNTSGVYTWTFPNAYGSGVVPVVSVSVEDGTSATWNHQISTPTNTSVTVQLTKTTAVTLLGISVLGISASPQAYVHLTAVAP